MTNCRKLACNHYFHLICLSKWFENGHNSCPICRTDIKFNEKIKNIIKNRINTGNNNKGKNKKPKKRTTPGAMQRQVEKGHAPREVKEVHNGHTKNGKPHVHFKDGTAINLDGTKSHDHAGTPPLTNAIKEWLHQNGHLRMIK